MTVLGPALTILATTLVAAFAASFTGALLLTLPSLFEDGVEASGIFHWVMIGLVASPFGMILTAPAALLGSAIAVMHRAKTGSWLPAPLVLAIGGMLGLITGIAVGALPSGDAIDVYFFVSFIIVGLVISYVSFRFMKKAWDFFA